jgi:Lon protease-like protein
MKRVPIFPLPNTVFFPRAKLPLHIFEPRYRQMVADALAGERLIVVVLLKPGWEDEYYENPPVHDTATLGTIEEHELLPDGRYNILLQGVERVRLVEGPDDIEPLLAGEKLYRSTWIAPAPETVPGADSPAEVEDRTRLLTLWQNLIDESGIQDADQSEIATNAPFEELVNQISMFSGLSAEIKQSLLEQDNLTERYRRLEVSLLEQIRYWSALNDFRRIAPEDPRVN